MLSGELPRQTYRTLLGVHVLLASALAGCGGGAADPAAISDLVSYRQEVAAWHAARLERLKGENGFLNLAGLFWLTEGTQRMGSAPGNEILLSPAKAAPLVGTLELDNGRVSFTAAADVDVRAAGAPVSHMVLADDSEEHADLLTHGTLAWFVIRRGNRFGIRLRDYASEALASFPGIEHFPVEPRWRVSAKLARYPEPRRLAVDTVVDGLSFEPVAPGVLRFELEGEPLELEAYAEDDGLFILFADATSGRTTYGAGRFLSAPDVDADGLTVLDFNLAYNPPCAFNDFATCPIAPLGNRLRLAIEAGEKYSAELHAAAE